MNPVAKYDFTLKCEDIKPQQVSAALRGWADKWVFQKERSDTGYDHYQGRIHLIKKRRLTEIAKKWKLVDVLKKAHLSITSNGCKDFNYVMKDDTRVAGPWSNENTHNWECKQVTMIEALYPWQQYVVDHVTDFDTRTINVIYDTDGCKGKSTLGLYLRFHNLGRMLPLFNDHKDLMRAVMSMPISTCYVIDFPRAYEGKRVNMLWAGIESVKNGYVYDDRYEFKEKMFNSPNIWVFCNRLPNKNLVSRDRWKLWTISEDMSLVEYDPEDSV